MAPEMVDDVREIFDPKNVAAARALDPKKIPAGHDGLACGGVTLKRAWVLTHALCPLRVENNRGGFYDV